MSRPILHVCSTCPGSDPDTLAAALGRTGVDVDLRPHPCLNLCGRPVGLALQGPGRATCLFHGVDPAEDAQDIAATIRSWNAAPDGWIVNALECGRLRHCLAGRVPAP